MTIILSIVGIFIFLIQSVTFLVFGWFIKPRNQEKFIGLDRTQYRFNYFSDDLNIRGFYFNTVPFPILGKYYNSYYGIVPKWSKLHREINRYKETLLDEILEN